jgi:apolipoprotein N-acyltransferase
MDRAMIPPRAWLAVGAAATGGTMLGLAFSGDAMGWLAWIALVPWLLVVSRLEPLQAFAFGWVGGLIAALVTFGWLGNVPGFGVAQFASLGSYVALYAACWCAGLAMLAQRRWSWFVFAPALWVSLDAVRNHAGFLALPIASLGQSQHANTALLQMASVGGEAAITWVVVLGNVAVAALVQRREWLRPLLALGTVAAIHAAGAFALAASPGDDGVAPIKVAAVQPNIGLHERDSAAGREAIWQRLTQLSLKAAVARPDLIVWPETSVGDPRHDPQLAERLLALSRAAGVPLLVGASETEKFAVAEPDGLGMRERDAYNAAYLVRAGVPIGEPYRKRRLMPFGEYTPLQGTVAWPSWLVPAMAQGRPGESDAGFEVPRSSSAAPALRVGVVICWENLFADLSRRSVLGSGGLLVQLTNDAWFGAGRAALQHNAASVIRAVENGVPLVLASNAGPSLVIDRDGRVVARTSLQFEPGVAVASVAAGQGPTLFSRWGNWFAAACCVASLLGLCSRGWSSGARRSLFRINGQEPGELPHAPASLR